MKKLIVLLLAIAMMLSACGSAPDSTTAEATTEATASLTFEQFQDKYKRESWGKLQNDPYTFLLDFKQMFNQKPGEWCPDLSIFEIKEEKDDSVEYEQDIVLFNKPFLFRFHVDKKYDYFNGSLSYYGDPGECFDLYVSMFDSLIANEGDPTELTAGSDVVNEATFRNALKEGPVKDGIDATLEASWKETTKSGEWFDIWYNNIQEGWIYIF